MENIMEDENYSAVAPTGSETEPEFIDDNCPDADLNIDPEFRDAMEFYDVNIDDVVIVNNDESYVIIPIEVAEQLMSDSDFVEKVDNGFNTIDDFIHYIEPVLRNNPDLDYDEPLPYMPSYMFEDVSAHLDQLCESKIQEVFQSLLPSQGLAVINESQMFSPAQVTRPLAFERRIGRIAVVNRIRNGKIQMNKKVDVMGKGYRLLKNGMVVKMSPKEILTRKRAAKIAARKRQLEMAQIVRRRLMSDRRRAAQIG